MYSRNDEKAMIFIDGSNLFKQSIRFRNEHNIPCDIDLIALRRKLRGNYNLIRTYYYGSIPDIEQYINKAKQEHEKISEEDLEKVKKEAQRKINSQVKFYHFLMYNGFDVTYFPLRKREKEIYCPLCKHNSIVNFWAEKGVDVALVTEMVYQSSQHNYDVLILVAGDLDYREAIKRIKQRGIKVVVAFFKSLTSPEFIRCADDFINIEEFLDEIQKNKKHK